MVAHACSWTVALKWFLHPSLPVPCQRISFSEIKDKALFDLLRVARSLSSLPCPNCGGELAFLAQYQRHYCYACGRYAPEGFGDRGAKRCPTCTGVLSYVTQYDRYYCYRCNAYPPEDAKLGSLTPTPQEGSLGLGTRSPTALVVTEPRAQTQAAVQDESSVAQEGVSTSAKRPLDREEIATAKKPLLAQLCSDHDLDASGTREELRQRLLDYLDHLEGVETSTEAVDESGEGPQGASPQPENEPPQGSEALESSSAEPTSEAVDEAIHSDESVEELTPSETAAERPDPRVVERQPAEAPPTASSAKTAMETSPRESAVTLFVQTPSTVSHSRESTSPEAPSGTSAKVEHPCPRCGRELTYIAQYDRWYCYPCRAYAPKTKAKFACPNCGSMLRWIAQYERWWCDSCRRYAPADLPRPERVVGVAPVTRSGAASTTAAAAATTVVHRHQNPGSGIGLLVFGLLLFVLYEVLVDLPIVLRVNTGLDVAPDVAFGLRFFAFLFVAAGALLGLSALRDRR